jgi:taurine dioxygenase
VNAHSGKIGAEITNPPDFTALTADDAAAFEHALAEHGVLVMHTDSLDPAQHRAFASIFGEFNPPGLIASLADDGYPEIGVISTDNGLAAYSHEWHADVTWMEEPVRFSSLHMQVSPPHGGDTMWSSQIAAYDALSDRMKAHLEGLTAHHSAHVNRPELCAQHPVVTRHPLTDRRSLFTNSLFTRSIDDMDPLESKALLGFLAAHSTRPEFTCRWQWRAGDLAIWDNHFVQHYAVGDYTADRKIHRIEVRKAAPLAAASEYTPA